jgi:hypothetical protein
MQRASALASCGLYSFAVYATSPVKYSAADSKAGRIITGTLKAPASIIGIQVNGSRRSFVTRPFT